VSKDRAAQLVEAGIWLKLSGDLEGARKLFERALKLDPENEKAKQFVAEVPSSSSSVSPRPPPPAAINVVLGSPSPPPQAAPSSMSARTVVLGSPSPIPQPPPAARTVVLSSPSPVPQIAPVTHEELEPPHKGPTMQFARPRELSGETEAKHKGPTMQFARPSELSGETEPAHRGPTMQFARPSELSADGETAQPAYLGDPEPAHKGPTMMFARPAEVEEHLDGQPEAPYRGGRTMEFALPPMATGATPDPLDVTSWDSGPVAQAPSADAPVTAKGSTMQFVRPPELAAAIKAARAVVPSASPATPLEIEPMGAPPQILKPPSDAPESWDAPGGWSTPTTAPAPVSAPELVTEKGSTMQFVRPPELTAALKAARAGSPPEPEAKGDETASWDMPGAWSSPNVPADAPVEPPQTAKGSTMQFARPPELAAAIKAARSIGPRASPSRPLQIESMDAPPEIVRPPAEEPESWVAPGGWSPSTAPVPPPAAEPEAPRGRTMQFARPAELGEAIKAAKAARAALAPESEKAAPEAPRPNDGPAAEPSPWDVPAWDTSNEPAAAAPTPSAPEPRKGSTMMFARPAEVASTRTTGKLFRTAEIDEARPPRASPPSPLDATSWDSAPETPAPAAERWTTSDTPGPRSTQQLFRDSSISSLDPESAPPSSPPLFAPEPALQNSGLQALGAMLGSPQGSDSPAPSSPPLFTGPAVSETPADPGSFAWAWSNGSPPPQHDDELIPPRPSPGLAPRATSAWDARSNPGVKIEAVVGQDKALDLIVSDSKITRSPDAKDQVPSLLKAARDLLELDDHTGAMDLILQAQTLAPDDPDVKDMRERSEKTLLTMYESKLGRLETVPRVLLKDDEIIWLNLDHRAGFVLAQIDGTVTLDDLFSVSGMSRLDTARILAQLVEEGVISPG
jgi:hypothetical protein